MFKLLDKKGRIYPMFVCDECGDVIRHAKEGLISWNPEGAEPGPNGAAVITDIRTLCIDCEGSSKHIFSMPLDVEVAFLLHNLGFKGAVKKAAEERADSYRRMDL